MARSSARRLQAPAATVAENPEAGDVAAGPRTQPIAERLRLTKTERFERRTQFGIVARPFERVLSFEKGVLRLQRVGERQEEPPGVLLRRWVLHEPAQLAQLRDDIREMLAQ